jgi:hypothetical protein
VFPAIAKSAEKILGPYFSGSQKHIQALTLALNYFKNRAGARLRAGVLA